MNGALGVLVILVGVAAAAHAADPSFDCAKARLWSEIQVCENATLAALDRDAAALFRAAKEASRGEAQRQLIAAQKAWLRERENCRQESAWMRCLVGVYERRMAQLGAETPPVPANHPVPGERLIAQVCWMGNECIREYLISSVRDGDRVHARVRDVELAEGAVTEGEPVDVTVSCRRRPPDDHAHAVEYTRWMALCKGERTQWSPR
jgi:uncharacterized protein